MPRPDPQADRTFDSPNRDFDPIVGKFPFAEEIEDGFSVPGVTLQTNPSGEYFRLVDFTDTFNYGQSLVSGVPGTTLPSETYPGGQSFGEYFSDLVVEAVQNI